MCVAYLQLQNVVTCLVFEICIIHSLQNVSQRPILPLFLRCTQETMHLEITSLHVNDNLTEYGF